MFIDKNQKRINVHAAFTAEDGTRYPSLTDPALRQHLGITEIADPQPPTEAAEHPDWYFRTEQDLAPYVAWTRKSDAQIAEEHNSRIDTQILGLERQALESGLVRTIIDDLLLRSVQLAAAQGVTEAELLDPNSPHYSRAYEKVHANAAERAVLRSQKL